MKSLTVFTLACLLTACGQQPPPPPHRPPMPSMNPMSGMTAEQMKETVRKFDSDAKTKAEDALSKAKTVEGTVGMGAEQRKSEDKMQTGY